MRGFLLKLPLAMHDSLAKVDGKKVTEICIELTFYSPPPTPLLPALTLSAGEHKVSVGEFEVSRQVGLPHNLRAPRSKAQNGLPLFLAAFLRLLSCRPT
jgi:hypothetical protein